MSFVRERPILLSFVALVLLIGAGSAIWYFINNRPAASTAEGSEIRGLLLGAVTAAVPLAKLSEMTLTDIRTSEGGEAQWREDIDAAIVDLITDVNAVTGNPAVEELSQRARFMLTRLPARLEKFRADVRRRVATIEQSACAVVMQGTREIAALDGELPENCIGFGRDDCEPFIREYMVVIDLSAATCE